MALNGLDKIGNWNPQLFRELRGHLKPHNLLTAGSISLLGQLLLLLFFYSYLPHNLINLANHAYCTGNHKGMVGINQCLRDGSGNLIFDWQRWWLEPFVCLSFIGIFALLVIGTYMLITDLAQEERRGTLNLIRLSPQSTASILVGKLLGVPVLLYLAVALAVPVHLWAGLSAQVPLGLILNFYTVLIASCIFFYSAALLYSLTSSWLGGFQALLGSGTVFIFLRVGSSFLLRLFGGDSAGPTSWLGLFSPATAAIPFLKQSSPGFWILFLGFDGVDLGALQWFYLPLGTGLASGSFVILNYSFWTYWIWQALKRCFRNPNATALSKRQSYTLVACFEVMILGFAFQKFSGNADGLRVTDWLSNHYYELLILNLLLFSGLIAALSPHRQALQDWARYRQIRVSSSKGFWNRPLVKDLLWGERSLALVAIALNLAITLAVVVPWVLLWPAEANKGQALLGLVLSMNLILIYAAIAQLMLLMRTAKRVLWASGTVGLAILLPLFLSVPFIASDSIPGLWLFTAIPYLDRLSTTKVFWGVLGQWSLLGLLSLQLTRQLRQAGASSTKALLASR